MPIRSGDPNVTRYIHQLEERIETLEAQARRPVKSGPTDAEVEKMVMAAVEKAVSEAVEKAVAVAVEKAVAVAVTKAVSEAVAKASRPTEPLRAR